MHPHTTRKQATAQLVNAPPPTRTTHIPPCRVRGGGGRNALALVSTAGRAATVDPSRPARAQRKALADVPSWVGAFTAQAPAEKHGAGHRGIIKLQRR
eukprot:6840429-Alexandrium_andersonii.AAC.1